MISKIQKYTEWKSLCGSPRRTKNKTLNLHVLSLISFSFTLMLFSDHMGWEFTRSLGTWDAYLPLIWIGKELSNSWKSFKKYWRSFQVSNKCMLLVVEILIILPRRIWTFCFMEDSCSLLGYVKCTSHINDIMTDHQAAEKECYRMTLYKHESQLCYNLPPLQNICIY